MNYIICFIALCLTIFETSAQVPTTNRYQFLLGSDKQEEIKKVIPGPEGTLLVIGQIETSTDGVDILLSSLDTTGALMWTKRIGGSREDYGVSAAVTFEEDGFIVVSNSNSFASRNNFDIVIYKINLKGEVLWVKSIGSEKSEIATSIAASTIEQAYMIAGNVTNVVDGEKNKDILTVKIDPNGVVKWAKMFGGQLTEYATTIEASSTGYLIAGETNSYGQGEFDVLAMSLSEEGLLNYAYTLGGLMSDYAVFFTQYDQDHFMLGLNTMNYGAGDMDFMLVKVNKKENKIKWSQTYGDDSLDCILAYHKDTKGNLNFIGYTTGFGAVQEDMLLFSTNKDGRFIEGKIMGGVQNDVGMYVSSPKYQYNTIVGMTSSFDALGTDLFFAKSDAFSSRYLCNSTLILPKMEPYQKIDSYKVEVYQVNATLVEKIISTSHSTDVELIKKDLCVDYKF
jgi:hypothetical protein